VFSRQFDALQHDAVEQRDMAEGDIDLF
jgi:hypothetical protein